MRSFTNALAFITGGSSGIGLEIAKQLFHAGSHVFILARRQELLETALAEMETQRVSPGQRSGIVQVDITDRGALKEALGLFIQTYGNPDLLINAAGAAHPGLFTDLDPNIFDWMMDVNFHGTVNVCREFVPGMIQRKTGHIVNISSVAGYGGVYGYTAYCASKYAVRGFSEALRTEVHPHGIRVTLVYPPDTDTPQLKYETQYKPAITKILSSKASILTPDEVARSILKGIRRNSVVITPGLENTVFYKLSNILGAGSHIALNWMVADAIKQQRKKSR